MAVNFVVLLVTMLAAGVLGGAVNYLMGLPTHPDEDEEVVSRQSPSWYNDRLFYHSIVLGVAAAFVVPVFLQIASIGVDKSPLTKFLESGHLGDNKPELAAAYASLATIGGFCVLAAVSSRSFLQTLSSKLLNQARDKAQDAQNMAKETREGVSRELNIRIEELARATGVSQSDIEEPIDESDQAEMEAEIQTSGTAAVFTGTGDGGELTDLDRSILKSLAARPNTRRSVKGIRGDSPLANDAGFSVTSRRLHRLHALGYVQKMDPLDTSSKLPRWRLDTKGWAAIDLG